MIRLAKSPDGIHVERLSLADHWDEMKIGPGAPPIRTPRGWLNLYYGVFPTMDGCVYPLGVAMHDLADPPVMLATGCSCPWPRGSGSHGQPRICART